MNDDASTLKLARNFLRSEKPPSITPVDILQIVYLMLRKAEDHDVFDSQQTIAKALNSSTWSVKRSQEKLERLGWLSRPQRRGKSNALSLRYQNIPAEEALIRQITPQARKLALGYKAALSKCRKKFPAQWLPQQFLSAQRILDLCSGNEQAASNLINYAFSHPQHARRARQSLYNLLGRWKRLVQDYSAALEAQERERQIKEQRPEVIVQ